MCCVVAVADTVVAAGAAMLVLVEEEALWTHHTGFLVLVRHSDKKTKSFQFKTQRTIQDINIL